jgi:hypothetical protein
MTEYKFTEEWIPVSDLSIDRAVQRSTFDRSKVERFKRNFNPAALGIITVSRRNKITLVIIDGMHRTETVRELTTNEGKVLCHVFENLTRAEEAQMFLDLNAGTQPSVLDKFRVRITAEDAVAIKIEELCRAYGWTITPNQGNGNIQCVKTLERINTLSDRIQAEPGLLQVVLMLVTHAWGKDKAAVQAVILEGIAALVGEHGSNLDLEILQRKLESYPGGPMGLHTDAVTLASMRRGKVTMAVAERLTDEYNKGRKTRTLHPWRRRA